MSEHGEMPRRGSEPAFADRWLVELVALRGGGPTQRHRAWGRLEPVPRQGPGWTILNAVVVVILILRLHIPRPTEDGGPERVALGLYPLDAAPGDLPDAIVELPLDSGVLEAVTAQGGEVDVRGVVGPGRGVVVVLDDGEVVGCIGPSDRRRPCSLVAAGAGPGARPVGRRAARRGRGRRGCRPCRSGRWRR